MRKLYRSRYDRKIAGICGGLGHYFRIDPVFIRLILIFICVLTAFIPILIVYLISALILPLEPVNTPAFEFKRLYRAHNDRFIAGICGGLARLLKMDPSVLRLIMIVIALVSGVAPMIIAYLVGWLIIPEKNL